MNHVEGTDHGQVQLFTLSTCIWCKKTKEFLAQMNVGYDYVEVDRLEGEDREKTMDELKRWNPSCSFPSLVVNNSACVVGYDVEKIKEALKL